MCDCGECGKVFECKIFERPHITFLSCRQHENLDVTETTGENE